MPNAPQRKGRQGDVASAGPHAQEPAVNAVSLAAPKIPAAPVAQKPPPQHAKPAYRAPESWTGMTEVNTFSGFTDSADRLMHAFQGRLTLGLSPPSLMLSYLDWLVHLGNSAGKAWELGQNALSKSFRFALYANEVVAGKESSPFIEPLPQDTRFTSPSWQQMPYSLYYQAFLLSEQWWHYATTGVRGVSPHHQNVVSFTTRQLLDMFAPSNYLMTNPDAIRVTMEQGGRNLVVGGQRFLDEIGRSLSGQSKPRDNGYQVGVNLACTPGKVIYRNQLIELIQYEPTTAEVRNEPILIVPAWIMKYYILDLSPHNSLVAYLRDRGYTVFMISWRNPGPGERDLSMDDYLRLGVLNSLNAIHSVCPGKRVHGVGYCLGGTLLSIAAATLARDNDDSLQSVTLFAAQTDFEEAGEIMLFIDDSQVTFLEDMMWNQGYLDTKQMSGAFQLLRSNDLIWSRLLKDYVLGEDDDLTDLMSWNSDATRMPYRMHSQYLRNLFLDNNLSKGRYQVEGRPIALTDIRVPICAVGTSKDHIAPWKSVFKINLFTDTEVTFILTGGGHNAGIVSEPGHKHRSFQMSTHRDEERYIDPDSWQKIAPRHEGSWWPAWADWLDARSSGVSPPPVMGGKAGSPNAFYNAPGEYVLMP